MVKERIPEHDHDSDGRLAVEIHDKFMQWKRKKGLLQLNKVMDFQIQTGKVLEIGPGCGYMGLEWLQNTKDTLLTGVEISPAFIDKATENSLLYNVSKRVKYVNADAKKLPFEDSSFDGVFSNASMHEWDEPEIIFNEIFRVLKKGGRFCVIDMHREVRPLIVFLLKRWLQPKEIRPGFKRSLPALYTADELKDIMKATKFHDYQVHKNSVMVWVNGIKN